MNNQEIKKCRKVMCDQNIRSKKEAQKWLLANHSDKGGVMDSGTFTDVTKCYQGKVFCPDEEEEGEGLGEESLDAKTLEREKIYNCYRQTENWSKMSMAHRFDNDKFDTEKVMASIHYSSPKLEQLLSIIKQVDRNDMETHGKLFKHFIFSDVKAGGYGAKILASALIANGYNSLLHSALIHGVHNLTLKKSQQKDDFNSFALLSSSAVYESNITQRMKKEILQRYNRRPDNIHGKDMRFIILDSGFKEGIDLFDVKYVHIFELSMTTADLKQTIGRATRTCGQKGLNFEPNVGWPLYVYNYYIAIPDSIKDVFLAANKDLIDPKYADEPIFKNRDKLKEVTSLYSKFDKSLIKLTDQLYRLAPIFSVDFELTRNIHKVDDVTYLYDVPPEALMYYGGAKRAVSDKINCAGKCGLRSTKDIPATVGFLRNVYLKHKHNKAKLPVKNAREYLCKYMKQSPDYCSQVNREWAARAAAVPSMVHKKGQSRKLGSRKLGRKLVLTTPTELSKEVMKELDLVPYVDQAEDLSKYSIVEYSPHKEPGMKQNKPGPPPRKLNFTKMRDFIKTNYGEKFTWQPYIIENKCIDKPQNNKTAKKTSNKSANKSAKKGKTSKKSKTGGAYTGGAYTGGAYAPPGYVEYINNQNKYMENGNIGNNGGDQASIMDYLTSFTGTKVQTGGAYGYGGAYAPPGYVEYINNENKYMANGDAGNNGGDQASMMDYLTSFKGSVSDVVSGGNANSKINYGALPCSGDESCDVGYDKTGAYSKGQGGGGQSQQRGGSSRIMDLNPTQNFIRTFFTPASPYKGMLLWQSVGSGKTCSAVATVTSSFEREGYTILWVTRTTLKSDVYKNIFDDVCHAILAEQMRDEGLEIPDKNRRRLLSKSWIEPISYRTFSNLLESDPLKPTNKYGELLLRRNGPEDILRKTIIVIDEAHKLYGGDLKWSERPNMEVMERLLRNSYKKSGKDSARLLIMTATPFTDSPMELFKLINLCKEDRDELITTDPVKFKSTYMSEDDDLTNAGVKKLADSLSGYISYLNRENDPTQFAQPIMIEVPAIMSHVEEPELRKHLYGNKEEKAEYREETKKEKADDKAKVKEAKDKLKETIKTLKTRMIDNKKTSNTTIKNRQERECKDIKNKAACNKRIKIEEEESLKASADAIQAEIDTLKTQMGEQKVKPAAENIRIKIKELKEKMLQEVMLVDRCKSIVMKK
jgi:hypothetical protein